MHRAPRHAVWIMPAAFEQVFSYFGVRARRHFQSINALGMADPVASDFNPWKQ